LVEATAHLRERKAMKKSQEHLAHIRRKDGKKQTLLDHLSSVSEKSSKFASKIGLERHGYLIGLWK
jgi:CRISPR-associated endonuclease/helicase Cas3